MLELWNRKLRIIVIEIVSDLVVNDSDEILNKHKIK